MIHHRPMPTLRQSHTRRTAGLTVALAMPVLRKRGEEPRSLPVALELPARCR